MMTMLGLTVSIEMAVKANVLRWFGHVLRTKKDNSVRMTLKFEVRGKRKIGRPKSTWKGKVNTRFEKISFKGRGLSKRNVFRLLETG